MHQHTLDRPDCSLCNEHFELGDRIVLEGRYGTCHLDCHQAVREAENLFRADNAKIPEPKLE